MGVAEIIAIVTFVVTYICGLIVKRIPQISDNPTPLQILAIDVKVEIFGNTIVEDSYTLEN